MVRETAKRSLHASPVENPTDHAPGWPIDSTASILASTSVGSASLVLVILSVNNFGNWLQALIALAGIALLFASGTVMDWHLDRFDAKAWRRIDRDRERIGEHTIAGKSHILRRYSVYAGGYFAIATALAVLTFSVSWIGFSELAQSALQYLPGHAALTAWLIRLVGLIFSVLLAVEVFVRLMTLEMPFSRFFAFVTYSFFITYATGLTVLGMFRLLAFFRDRTSPLYHLSPSLFDNALLIGGLLAAVLAVLIAAVALIRRIEPALGRLLTRLSGHEPTGS